MTTPLCIFSKIIVFETDNPFSIVLAFEILSTLTDIHKEKQIQ